MVLASQRVPSVPGLYNRNYGRQSRSTGAIRRVEWRSDNNRILELHCRERTRYYAALLVHRSWRAESSILLERTRDQLRLFAGGQRGSCEHELAEPPRRFLAAADQPLVSGPDEHSGAVLSSEGGTIQPVKPRQIGIATQQFFSLAAVQADRVAGQSSNS